MPKRTSYILCYSLLVVLFILKAPLNSWAQSTTQDLNETDAKGLKQGKWVKKHTNGNIRYTGQFENDKPVGHFQYFYETGKPKATIIHAGDGKHATTTLFAEDGSKMAEGFYTNQLKDSTWKYFDSKGNLSAIECYKNTKMHGIWKTFYQADTAIAELTTYKDGKKNGPWKQFFKSGKLKCAGFYFNENLDGEYIGFNTEGITLYKGQYIDGLREGLWEYFTDEGKLKTKEWYKDGEMVKEEILIKDEPLNDTPLDPSLDPEKEREGGSGFGG